MPMPRMRTIDQAFKEIQKSDPETNFTKWRLRTLVVTGAVPTFRAGSRYLINMDQLYAYLEKCSQAVETEPELQGIKPIY